MKKLFTLLCILTLTTVSTTSFGMKRKAENVLKDKRQLKRSRTGDHVHQSTVADTIMSQESSSSSSSSSASSSATATTSSVNDSDDTEMKETKASKNSDGLDEFFDSLFDSLIDKMSSLTLEEEAHDLLNEFSEVYQTMTVAQKQKFMQKIQKSSSKKQCLALLSTQQS